MPLTCGYSASKYRKLIQRFEDDFPAPMVPTYVVENHDRTRSLSRMGGDLRKARTLATLLCTLRGVPFLYQGQEIGMENQYIPLRKATTPGIGSLPHESATRAAWHRLERALPGDADGDGR